MGGSAAFSPHDSHSSYYLHHDPSRIRADCAVAPSSSLSYSSRSSNHFSRWRMLIRRLARFNDDQKEDEHEYDSDEDDEDEDEYDSDEEEDVSLDMDMNRLALLEAQLFAKDTSGVAPTLDIENSNPTTAAISATTFLDENTNNELLLRMKICLRFKRADSAS